MITEVYGGTDLDQCAHIRDIISVLFVNNKIWRVAKFLVTLKLIKTYPFIGLKTKRKKLNPMTRSA